MMKARIFEVLKPYLKEEFVWKTIFDIVPEDTILFLDIEVYPLIKDEIPPEAKIVGIGVSYRDKIQVKVGEEKEVLEWFNRLLFDKEIYVTVGYGTLYLDIPLLLIKARKYRSLRALIRVLNKVPHYDLVNTTPLYLYMIRKANTIKYYPLEEVASMLGLPKTSKFSEELYNDSKKMEEYLKEDVKTVVELFKIIKKEFYSQL